MFEIKANICLNMEMEVIIEVGERYFAFGKI